MPRAGGAESSWVWLELYDNTTHKAMRKCDIYQISQASSVVVSRTGERDALIADSYVMWRNAGTGRSSAGSDVVMIDSPDSSLRVSDTPNVASLNVTNSPQFHLGPKIFNVNQTVHHSEVIKGQMLGLELVSAQSRRRLRCSVAVFVCWAFLVAGVLAFIVFYFALHKEQTRLDIGLKEPWYLRRGDWQAMPPYTVQFLQLPVRTVVIGHSVTKPCSNKYSCIQTVLSIQQDHLRRDYDDIGPNYLISTDGLLFEGRGANVKAAMVKLWNSKSITIMFLGNYVHDTAQIVQFDHINILLDILVKKGVLHPDYVVYGFCQLATYVISPGPGVMKQMNRFSHWNPIDANKYLPMSSYLCMLLRSTTRMERVFCGAAVAALVICITLVTYFSIHRHRESDPDDTAPHEWNITRDMWLSRPYNYTYYTHEYEPVKLVIVQHTVSPDCYTFTNCAAELRILQDYFIDEEGHDIPYNFIIGNDGRVYEGRGWSVQGAHTKGYNSCSIGLGFIGDYRENAGTLHTKVSKAQLNRTLMLLDESIRQGFLHKDYFIIGAKDLQASESPGENLYNALLQMDHYDHENRFYKKNCDEIEEIFAQRRRSV